ncbi:hypothetical protein IU474_06065 [Nocardia otitidiscaviarum]|uniref:hypothetical protein n=1 Tax=Nocardia otitidiscaviarum TaxID=1823 RepID=UPI0018930C67|nr:hypothetical protein [Nocardia otitidiscaviarum]MBF6236643.1 hypothetical protein [Nocardia otitidiscaviarum]
MNRLNLFLIAVLFGLLSLLLAPGFVFSVLFTAVVLVVGVRWFARVANPRHRNRGVWR